MSTPPLSGLGTRRNTVGEQMDVLRRRKHAGPALYVLTVAVVALAYYGAGRIGLELAYLNGAVAALWPPAGLGLAVLFLYGVRLWPAIVIGDLLLSDYSTPLGTVLAQTLGNTVAVVVAALLLRRLTGGRAGLDRVADVLAFVACALVTAGVSAAFGPLSLRLGGVISADQLGQVLRTWTLGDAAGVLVVAPFVLTWATAGLWAIHRRELMEGTVVLAVLVALAELTPQRDVPYIVFPVLLWAAVRFGPRGAATAVLVVCSITVWNTAQNDGPFVRDSITESLLATQLFIAVSALTSLVLAAETAERTRAGVALAASEASQRALADEQAALRRVATLVASGLPPSRVFGQVTEEVAMLLAMPGANVMRYDNARTATVVGGWSEDGALTLPMGSTFDLDGDSVVAQVLRSGTPQRVDRYQDTRGNLAETMHRSGYRAAVAAPVTVGGRLWGALAAGTRSDKPLPEGLEQRLCDFAELVAQALANADAHEQLAASRARIVEAGDAERRRLERNLHDGAQQRLVALAVDLTLIGARLENDPSAARKTLAVAQDDLLKGIDELRELARGIHPAVLTDRGLGPALQALVKRAPVPVEITELPEQRLASPVEAAAYYVVAEAITNVTKYARASHVTVSIHRSSECATITVSDDGVGGADAAHGSGLRGLADRIEALEGQFYLDSPPERGTRISAEIPVQRSPAHA
jgi:signal transduction histidine kinase